MTSLCLSFIFLVTCSFRVGHGKTVVIETLPVYNFMFLDDYGVYVTQPRQMSFNIQAKNDAHISLAKTKGNTTVDSYEVIIGGWQNTRSTVLRCVQCPVDWAVNYGPLNGSVQLPFWITWAFNISGGLTIRVGTGYVVLQNEFMSWYDPDPHDIDFVGISTGWQANGSWIFEIVDGGWSGWGQWTPCAGSCEISGLRARERICNNPSPVYGQPCNGSARQYESCNYTDNSCQDDWTVWSSWNQCSVTCGNGVMTRGRRCLTAPDHPCSGSKVDQNTCQMITCPVNGSWSAWQQWSTCSVSCGQGTRTRLRSCVNPSGLTSGSGPTCTGTSTDSEECQTGLCPVNGVWSEWQQWSSCSVSCGGGSRTRQRSCNDPSIPSEGSSCPGSASQDEPCQLSSTCPVNGGWTDWGQWSGCSSSCGNGTRIRIRVCSISFPDANGGRCTGNSSEETFCFNEPCSLNGSWSEWQLWSSCSRSCGNGTRQRTKECIDDTSCPGRNLEESSCLVEDCPITGQWSDWSSWSDCSLTCGRGRSSRIRQCVNSSFQFTEAECNGTSVEEMECNNSSCTIDRSGMWGDWGTWSSCSLSCGVGQRLRRRTCVPSNPGTPVPVCPGSGEDIVNCKLDDCATNAATWSDWTQWSVCSLTCGTGWQTRSRSCTIPDVGWDQLPCTGSGNETQICRSNSCPVDGEWSDWSNWSDTCPSCGSGVTTRFRNCSNPAPSFGGNNCSGDSSQLTNCSNRPCPVDGGWSDWSEWSDTCPSCGSGVTTRFRNCSNPAPNFSGTNCSGDSLEVTNCSSPPCPVDGKWNDWSPWSSTCPSCGPGVTTRIRTCANLYPDFGGMNCSGESLQRNNCSYLPCPVDGEWSDWSEWSDTCPSCGSGVTTRFRNCSNPVPSFGGNNCSGDSSQLTNCSSLPCPVNGSWSAWSPWSHCPLCGHEVTNRSRSCSNPLPAFGGRNCSGRSFQSVNCTIPPCPVNGSWSGWTIWSDCSATCDLGQATRFRDCSNPSPEFGGSNCTGIDADVKRCNLRSCPVDGMWSLWTNWNDCNATCGLGWTTRKRACNNPRPISGGQPCPGNETDARSCNNPCPISRGGSNNGPAPMEAPGAQAIGVIGIGICVALIAAIMLLDLVSIHKHFAFMRRNINYGWQRIMSKFRPMTSNSQRRKTFRRSTVRRLHSTENQVVVEKGKRRLPEALGEQQSVTLKRTVSGTKEVAGTFPVLAPRPAKRQLVHSKSNPGSGTTTRKVENSLGGYTDRRSHLANESDTRL